MSMAFNDTLIGGNSNEDKTKNIENTTTQSNKHLPSQTLLVYKVPSGVTSQMIQQLFEKEPGFIKSRNLRNIYFIDFVTIPVALVAMRRYQGYKFPGYEKSPGIVIDYENNTYANPLDADKLIQFFENDSRFHIYIHCPTCLNKILHLRLLPPLSLPNLPRREYDSTIVIDCSKIVLEHQLTSTDIKPEFRKEGVEIRYSLICNTCGDQLAYSFTSVEQGIQYIFLLPSVLAYDYKNRQIPLNDKNITASSIISSTVGSTVEDIYIDDAYSLISK